MQQYPLVTIVGGSGFVGRHTLKPFLAAGWRVRVLVRDLVSAEFVKMAGYPGQVVLEHADIARPETLAGKFAGSTAVINLVGIAYSRGKQNFNAVHVNGARAVAEQAAKVGAQSFVQVSALGLDADSAYASTKKAGEEAVRAAFPSATILRPSLLVGPEDLFFQRFARMSLLTSTIPLVAGGKTQFQPLLVTDLAQAIFLAASKSEHAGKTYDLAGPEVFTFRQLMQLMAETTHRKLCLVPLPAGVASLIGGISEILPFPPAITRDQVKQLKSDSVLGDHANGFDALGIVPQSIRSVLPHYLARYTKAA